MPVVNSTNVRELAELLAQIESLTPFDEEASTNFAVRSWDQIIDIDFALPWTMSREERRDETVARLGRWAKRLVQFGPVTKDFGEYRVELSVQAGDWRIEVSATTDAVCERKPVLDDDGKPKLERKVTVKHGPSFELVEMVPVTEKVCPPSLLEAAARAELADVDEVV